MFEYPESTPVLIVSLLSVTVILCMFFYCAQDSDAYTCSAACARGHQRMIEVTRTKCVCEVKP